MFDTSSLPLHDYQLFTKKFMEDNPKCGVFLPMGAGKSLITLAAICDINPPGHILVVAPKNIARSVWQDEIDKWKIPIRTKSFVVESDPSSKRFGKPLGRKARLKKYADVVTDPPTMYFINRELLCDLIDNMPVQGGRPVWYFPTVIADESQSFKNPASKRFKAMKYVQACITRFVELTGTPTPQGLLDLWSQIYLLDGGARLGRTVSDYKSTFFRPVMYVNNRPVKWELLPGAEEEIYRRIGDIVISVKNPNVKLPPVTYTDVNVHLDPEEMDLYKRFARQSILEAPDWKAVAVNRAVLGSKLAQLASGAIYTKPPDPKDPADGDDPCAAIAVPDVPAAPIVLPPPVNVKGVPEFRVIHTKKLDMCEYIIENSDGPVLVAYHFKSDREMLLQRFPHAVVFNGDAAVTHAWNDGRIPLMLLQPASAGHGLNLQSGGHTLIWYTIQTNLEYYLQTNARLHRQGQRYPVMIYHLLVEGTVDLKHLAMLADKDQSEQRLMDAVQAAVDFVMT